MARTLSEVLRKPRKRKLLVRHTLTTTTVPGENEDDDDDYYDDDDDDDDYYSNNENETGTTKRRNSKRKQPALPRWMRLQQYNRSSKNNSNNNNNNNKKQNKDEMVIIDDSSSDDNDDGGCDGDIGGDEENNGSNHKLIAAARSLSWKFSPEDMFHHHPNVVAERVAAASTNINTASQSRHRKKFNNNDREGNDDYDDDDYNNKNAKDNEETANDAKDKTKKLVVDGLCHGTNQRGQRCGCIPRPGQLYCHKHNKSYDTHKSNHQVQPEQQQQQQQLPANEVTSFEPIRCWAISQRGFRCNKYVKAKDGKFCAHHEKGQPYGVIDNNDDDNNEGTHGDDSTAPNRPRRSSRENSEEARSRKICHAMCNDGYRCSRLSNPGDRFCALHSTKRTFGEVISSDDESIRSDEPEGDWAAIRAAESGLGAPRIYSSGAEQCRAMNIRSKRCGKPAFGDSVYCFAHQNPEKRTFTIDDLAAFSNEESERSLAPSDDAPSKSSVSDRDGDGPEGKTRRQCQSTCTRNTKRCAKPVYGNYNYCLVHWKIRTNQKADGPDSDEEDEVYDDEESDVADDDDDDEEEEEEEGGRKHGRPRDCIYRGEPGTVPCNALTNRLRVCTHQAAKGHKFCHLHIAKPPKFTKDSGMASTEGLGNKLRFFRGELGSSQCDAFNNSGQLCPYVADDDSVHCRFHRGSDRSRANLYCNEPGTRPCSERSQYATAKPCPYRADDDSVHCPYHRGTGDSMDKQTTDVASKSPASVETKKAASTPLKSSTEAKSPPESVTSKSPRKKRRRKRGNIVFDGKNCNGRSQCAAVTKRGNRCTFSAVEGTAFCYTHMDNDDAQIEDALDEDEAEAEAEDDRKVAAAGDDSLEGDGDDSSLASDNDPDKKKERPFSYREFLNMWQECEEFCGEETDEIESTRRVRGANHRISPEDTDGQLKAQYGRLLPRAMKTLMRDILGLKKDDVFLDIGHGIGNTCMQAAFTVGCEARGIEVVYGRNSIAEVFRDQLVSRAKDDEDRMPVGKILLRHGRLEDETHREFLTKGVTRAYVNNFNGVFAERSSKLNQTYFLDDYVAGLFALMAPGAIMTTLHPLSMGPTRNEANEVRVKQGLKQSEYSSFYETDKVLLGKACDTVKWNQHSGNQKNIYVYKYERLEQPSDEAVFLCCNPSCEKAKNEVPIPATTTNEEGRIVINYCSCKVSTKTLRRQRRKLYADIS